MNAPSAPKRETLARRILQRVRRRRPAESRFGRGTAPLAPLPKPSAAAPSARFLAALLLPFLAAFVEWRYWPMIEPFTWFLFYPAAFFSSWIGGTRAGILSTLESALLGTLFFAPHEQFFMAHGVHALIPTGLFILMGAFFSVVHGRLRKVTDGWRAASMELTELFERASDGIFLADLEGRYTDVNDAACRMLGRTREDLLGKSIADLIAPEHRARLLEDREIMLRSGGVRVGEWELKKGDGSVAYVEVSASILPDGRWQAFVRDIAERKRAELRTALDSAANAMVMVDGSGRIVLSNAEAERMFAYAPGELDGRLIEALIPERFRTAHPARREEFFHGPVDRRALGAGRILPALRKDGGEFPAEVGLARVRAGGETMVVASILDVSERVAAEQKLLASEERLRLFVQNVKDYAIYMHDAEGNVTVWNEGAERILGYSAEEILGRSYRIFYTPEDLAAGVADRDMKTAIEKGSLHVEEWRVRKNGTRFLANIVANPVLGRDGKLVGYGMVIRDLTELKSAEAALKATAENLRRTVEDLEGFAYTASHDLRSPLRAIQGYAHFTRERMRDKADPESLSMLDRIAASAVRLDRLIRDVLSYSAISREKVALAPVDLDKIVAHVVDLYPILRTARLDVRGPLGVVLAQQSLMLQIVSNLLVNAVKFVPAGREAAITVRTEGGAPGSLSLIVEDNGPGIPRVHWDRIFQPFQRLPGAEATAGSGIGLAIVKRAVDRLGGTIRVDSEPCTGTRFTVELAEASHDG
jgi:PAS domain S-box-containing protein